MNPGDRVEGYEVVEVLSRSAGGAVYRVVDRDGDSLILKELRFSGDARDLEERGALLIDALEFLYALENPALAGVLDFFSAHRRAFAVMEDIRGETLESARRERAFTVTEIIDIVCRLCAALVSMQSGGRRYRFGALAPSHILVDDEGLPHLVNYGLGRFFTSYRPCGALTAGGAAPPEDIEDLGRIIVFLATGGEALMDSMPEGIPSPLRPIVRRFLPGGRPFGSLAELYDELRAHGEAALRSPPPAEAAAAPPEPLPQRKPFPLARTSAALLAVALLILLTLHGLTPSRTFAGKALVLCNDGTVMIHSAGSGRVVGSFEVEGEPSDLVYTEEDRRLVLALPSSKSLVTLDPATGRTVGTTRLREGADRLLAAEEGSPLFATGSANTIMTVLSGTRRQDQEIYSIGMAPRAMAFDRARRLLYLACRESDLLLTVDLTTSQVLPGRMVDGGPTALALIPRQNELWCAMGRTSYLRILDAPSLSEKRLIPLRGQNPADLVASPDGSCVYVALFGSDTAARLPVSGDELQARKYVAVGRKPCALALAPDGRLWVANSASGTLSIIDGDAFTQAREVKTGNRPRRIVFVP